MKLAYRFFVFCSYFKAWFVVKIKGGSGTWHIEVFRVFRSASSLNPLIISLKTQTYLTRLVRLKISFQALYVVDL
jgi:hypothetical protein